MNSYRRDSQVDRRRTCARANARPSYTGPAISMALAQDPRCVASGQLQGVETATTVRVDSATGAPLTTDGPFADTKEVFGGYYILDAGNLDEAIEAASRIPAARNHGSVEVRPIVEH